MGEGKEAEAISKQGRKEQTPRVRALPTFLLSKQKAIRNSFGALGYLGTAQACTKSQKQRHEDQQCNQQSGPSLVGGLHTTGQQTGSKRVETPNQISPPARQYQVFLLYSSSNSTRRFSADAEFSLFCHDAAESSLTGVFIYSFQNGYMNSRWAFCEDSVPLSWLLE